MGIQITDSPFELTGSTGLPNLAGLRSLRQTYPKYYGVMV